LTLLIGDMARLAGLSIHTLRYYDERGLLPQVKRAENGHRVFDVDDVDFIVILKCLRATEMPLADIECFTKLVQDGPITAGERRALPEAHRREVESRLREIKTALKRIDERIVHYRTIESHENEVKQPSKAQTVHDDDTEEREKSA
jgi:MerR family transcriptional regulator, aldehyde-responsive regulator